MESTLFEKFTQLSAKIQAILDEKNALKEEIRYYQAENKELRTALQLSKTGVAPLNPPAENTKIASKNGSYAEQVATIARQIDVYVDEIDHCIAQLGS